MCRKPIVRGRLRLHRGAHVHTFPFFWQRMDQTVHLCATHGGSERLRHIYRLGLSTKRTIREPPALVEANIQQMVGFW